MNKFPLHKNLSKITFALILVVFLVVLTTIVPPHDISKKIDRTGGNDTMQDQNIEFEMK